MTARKRTTKRATPARRKARTPARKRAAATRKKASPTRRRVVAPKAPWVQAKADLGGGATGGVSALIVPWGQGGGLGASGAVRSGKYWFYPSHVLPAALEHLRAPDYSWADYIARKTDGRAVTRAPRPTEDTGKYTLRPDQEVDRDAIVSAFAAGAPEFLLASETGVGKTVVAVSAALKTPGLKRVLVLCPAPVQQVWRQHLADMGDGGMDWVVLNYESNKNLLKPDSRTLNAKKTATKNKNLALYGTPWEKFDLVITDEAHMTANPTSQQTRVTEKMIDSGGLSLRITATPGRDPSRIHYLRRGLAYATETPVFDVSNSLDPYVSWARSQGIAGLSPAPFGAGIQWDGPEDELTRMHQIIFNPDSGNSWALRSEPQGWPEQLRSAFPVSLTDEEMRLYETEWSEFAKAMRGLPADRGAARTQGLAAQIRYRQKVGTLKAPYVASHAKMLLDGGHQVLIAAIYQHTVTAITEQLSKSGYEVALFTGSNTATREAERVAFQRGEKRVIIFTTTTGISLHAGEDASGATMDPRALIVAEPQWSPLAAAQVEGRGTRDAQHAHAYYPYAVGTNDEKVVRTMVTGLGTMNKMRGSDTALLEQLSQTLGFELFPD